MIKYCQNIRVISIVFFLTGTFLFYMPVMSQPVEATLLENWQNDSITMTAWLSSRYNETWGVTLHDQEFAIIGSTEGVHFFELSQTGDLQEIPNAFVAGADAGPHLVHRDYHDYQGYLYTVADEGVSTMQVIDLQGLPDSTEVVYDSPDIVTTAHNIFIDTASALLYACGARKPTEARVPLKVISLADPKNPELIKSYSFIGGQSLPLIHDIFVRNDTAFLNGGSFGLIVADFSDPENPELMGTLTDYPDAGYNHSGWLSDDGRFYFMADETHGMDLKVVDISDPADMRVVTLFDAEAAAPSSIPHNLLVNCNRLYVSYYYDGLQVYDISDPVNPVRIAYYDTYDGADAAFFAGAWGVYPFPGSERILVSDMQGGLFVFEDVGGPDCGITSSVPSSKSKAVQLSVYPNPAQGQVSLTINGEWPISQSVNIRLLSMDGKKYWSAEKSFINDTLFLELPDLPAGIYLVEVSSDSFLAQARILLTKS